MKRLILLKLFIFILKSSDSKKHCCEVITINSAGTLADFEPEVLGTYKKLKHRKTIYQHLSNSNSYIYHMNLATGMYSSGWHLDNPYLRFLTYLFSKVGRIFFKITLNSKQVVKDLLCSKKSCQIISNCLE